MRHTKEASLLSHFLSNKGIKKRGYTYARAKEKRDMQTFVKQKYRFELQNIESVAPNFKSK